MLTCQASTNSTEVAFTDTTLGGTTYGKTQTEVTNYSIVTIEGKQYYKCTARYLWALGAFNNITINKIGILMTGNVLIAGQLIRDTEGSPVSITILSDEQLDVTYTIYIPVMAAVTGDTLYTVNVNGVDHQYRVNQLLQNIVYVNRK